MKQKFFSSIILTVILLLFSIQNIKPITIRLLFFKFDLPASVLIIACAFIGGLIAYGLSVFKEMTYKKTIRAKNREISSLKREISKLNNSAFGQEVDTEPDEEEKNASYIDSIFADKRQKEAENEKIKDQFEDLIDKNIKKSQTEKKEEKTKKQKENTENDDSAHAEIDAKLSPSDYKMVGFDDLDLKSFSFENLIDKSKSQDKKDDQWFMGDSKKIDLEKEEEKKKKEEQFKEKIDIKNGYQKILSEFDNKKNKPYKPSTNNQIQLDSENEIHVTQERTILNVKKEKDDDDDDKKNPPSPPKNDNDQKKDDENQKTKILNRDDIIKHIEKAETEKENPKENIEKNTDKDENIILNELKKQIEKPLNYNISQEDITTKSFLKVHRQDTTRENTLSHESIIKNFNWDYDRNIIQKHENESEIKTLKQKIGELFSPGKDFSDSLNN